MVISWIVTLSVVINVTWSKIIPVLPPTKEFGKRVDNNPLQLYPNWQPIQPDLGTTQQNHFQTLDLRSQTQTLPILGIPQAQGLKLPQFETFKTQNQDQNLETQLPLRLPPLEGELLTIEQTTQNIKIEDVKPQTEALQRYPLSGNQYYQLNPYQDSRLLTSQTKPNYYQPNNIPLPQNKPTYYQTPNILSNSVDLRLLASPNLNYQNLNTPSQTLTVPKESLWNPASNPELLYNGKSLENNENTHDSSEDLKSLTAVHTVPKHYKFEKINKKSKETKHSNENINDSSKEIPSKSRTVPKHYKFEKTNTKTKQSKPKEKLKNKDKHKNNIKLSSDHVSDIVKEPKGSQNSNDWVPIVRTVPKHYTFEKNSLENKEKPKNKKKLKGEPVEKVNNPKHYIFEQGSLVKKFKQNKFLEREPLQEEAFDEPKKTSKKPKKNKEKVKPVHELLDEPSTELDANEKESNLLENQRLVKEKPTHKKLPSHDQENLESDPYFNHKEANNNDFKHDHFGEFNGGPNGVQAHHGGAAPPPASKDRTQFHMVGHDGPMSYKWGFDTGAGEQRQYRFEERDKEGIVKGQFGYLDDKGKFRKMNYNAHPVHGFSMEPADGTFDDLKA